MKAVSTLMRNSQGSSSPPPGADRFAAFKVAVRPFFLLSYLVSFAYTKDSLVAEDVAVKALASAFRLWKQRQSADELKRCLIRVTLSEARTCLHRHPPRDLDNCPQEIGDSFVSQAVAVCRPIPRDAIHPDALRRTLMGTIQRLASGAAVALLLRDVFHLTTLEIAELMGESQQRVRAWLAYGRFALCVELAKSASTHDLAGDASLAATC